MTIKKRAAVTALLLAALFVGALTHLRSGGLTLATPAAQEKLDRDDLPVADIRTSDSGARSPLRRAKSSRYDYKGDKTDVKRFRLKESDPEEAFDLPLSHATATPAIPAAQSDAVVVGVVDDAKAFLSTDETSVYSEFVVSVESVLKDAPSQPVAGASSVTLERQGGAVRFPSGKILRRGKLRERMPLVKRRYVFFLRSQSEDGSFEIITGYELRGGKVFPLDGVDTPLGGTKLPQFAAYEGTDEKTFLERVREALSWASSESA